VVQKTLTDTCEQGHGTGAGKKIKLSCGPDRKEPSVVAIRPLHTTVLCPWGWWRAGWLLAGSIREGIPDPLL